MNINQLRFVRAAAELASFSRAAEYCHVTQPTLSNGIAQLEAELQGRLFDRSTRSVRLSALGRALLPLIERSLDDLNELRAAAQRWREPSHKLIRIGLSPVIDMALMQTVLAPFRAQYPEVEFFFKECYLNDLDARLDAGQLDVAFLPRGYLSRPAAQVDFYSEPLCYIAREGASLASLSSIRLSDAAQEALILTIDACGLRSVTQELFQQQGLPIREYPGQATSYAVVEQWAALGIGAGILPRSKVSADNAQARPLVLDSGQPARIACEAVWDPAAADIAHLQAFFAHLSAVAPKLQQA